LWLMQREVVPRIEAFRPEAVMLLPGADALADDAMSRLALSNRGLWAAVAAVRPLAARLVVLGGGGYNPFALARAWAGIWAVLNDRPIPDVLPDAALDVLAGIEYFRGQARPRPGHWLTTLADPPQNAGVRADFGVFR
jgi:acetoin utilization protein AcuC